MREVIKTSLISILCVVTTMAANAAPTVRSIGGTGTYDSAASAANANVSSRAGSLRSTGGYIRPTATLSTSGTPVTATNTATTGTTTGGSVATGGGTTGRVASTPRLSIGKYVGAPKSVSTSAAVGNDLTQRVEKLEGDVASLETDKQDALQDSTYITIQKDELILNLDKIKQDLDIQEDRDIDFKDDDTGLYWHYVDEGDETWREVITWDVLRSKLDFESVDSTINTRVGDLRTEIENELKKKVDKFQGDDPNLVGKALVVDANGYVQPTGEFAKVGDVYNKTDVYTKSEVQTIIDSINDTIVTEDDLKKKVDVFQGDDPNLVGMAMVVNRNGNLEPTGDFVLAGELDNVVENYQLDDLGELAYLDRVGTAQINAKAVTPSKLADDVSNTLDQVNAWQDWWNNNKPGEGDYVMSVQADGTRQWFRIVTAENAGEFEISIEP